MSSRPLRIGVDARYLSHGLVGGVHTYLTRLLPELIVEGGENHFTLYADGKAALELEAPPQVTVRTLPWRHASSSIVNDWWRLERSMAADRIDVAFFPANHGFGPRGAAAVITLHDALNLKPLRHTLAARGSSRGARGRLVDVYLNGITSRSVDRATRLITMSEYSKTTIVAASGREPDEVTVVYHGAPRKMTLTPAEIDASIASLGVARPFVLADGLKNPVVVLHALAKLAGGPAPPFRTVFFSRHNRVLPELRAAADAGTVTLLVRPSAAELACLYSAASAFVFPSWVEGFGIPLLEAMIYGAPIVASDRGSIPEVVERAALLMDADDSDALAAHLVRVLSDPTEAERLRALGHHRAARFTWKRSALETLAVLRRAHAEVVARRGEASDR